MAQTASLPAPAQPMIEAVDVGKRFGEQIAVDGVSLSVSPGVIVGVIGPSGCGKTTLIRLLTGISRPTSGAIKVFGEDPASLTTRQRMRFGYMPQLPVLFPNLSLWGNLSFVSSVYGLPLHRRRRRLSALLDLVDLADHRRKRLADCSGGMQRRLSLAATLVHEPELLYLDEPTAGVDPILRERFWTHFRDLRDSGKTVVVSTQYVGEAASCDLVAVMAEGRLVALEPPGALTRLAFGGDPVLVRLDRGWLAGSELDRLRALDAVRSVRFADDGLLVVLDDGARSELVERRLGELGIVAETETYAPDLDEVFVEIVQAYVATAKDAAA